MAAQSSAPLMIPAQRQIEHGRLLLEDAVLHLDRQSDGARHVPDRHGLERTTSRRPGFDALRNGGDLFELDFEEILRRLTQQLIVTGKPWRPPTMPPDLWVCCLACRVAQAQALIPGLTVVPAQPEENSRALELLAAWLRYAPLTAPDRPDGVWIDATGCSHLFGGDASMLADVVEPSVAIANKLSRLVCNLIISSI